MCATSTTTTTTTTMAASLDANATYDEKAPPSPSPSPPPPPPPPYKLREHCQYLNLRTESLASNSNHSYWYCDWTTKLVSNRTSSTTPLLKDVVKDYCQPFATLAILQDSHVGLEPLSFHTEEDPLAVRTTSIRLRPDAPHYQIWKAVHEAFRSQHSQEYVILKSTPQTFQALGAHASTPYFVSCFITVHTRTLERRLWIRFYHVDALLASLKQGDAQIPLPTQEQIQKLLNRCSNDQSSSSSSSFRMAPLRSALTPINILLAEACVLIQFIQEGKLQPGDECPASNREETSRFWQTTYTPSLSTRQVSQEKGQQRRHDALHLFPSLNNDDYPILQESHSLLTRIWSELEDAKFTFNTLQEETCRFGMRPCLSTLDKDYCWALSQISQQHMLLELQTHIVEAESILHDTLQEYQELETFLMDVIRKYRIPISASLSSSSANSSSANLDIGQTPIKIPKRKMADFPWQQGVKKALEQVSHEIAQNCLQAFDASKSIQMAEDAAHYVFTAFGQQDDIDQKQFLKQRNQQAMIRVSQQQARLKHLLTRIILAPTEWQGLPELQLHSQVWFEFCLQSATSNTRRNPVPLLEFRTKLGQACITAHQLIVVSGVLSTRVDVYDWTEIDVVLPPTSRSYSYSLVSAAAAAPWNQCAVLLMQNGKRIGGLNPVDVHVDKLVKLIHSLKQLQEA